MEDKDVTDNEHDKGNVGKTRCSLEGEKTTRKRGIETTDISPFCDQLEKFIKYIGNFRDLNFLTYNYPNVLENRLDSEVRELESMLAEVKEAMVRVERVKMQRRSIKKEKIAVTRTLKRMRDDEIREMECVLSLYDKPMFSRWENVRDTHNPEIFEGMLMDIQGKQLALENLKILATRKLSQIQTFKPRLGTDPEKKCTDVREKSVIALPFPSFCPSLPPLPPPPPPLPPLPPSLPLTIPLASNLPKRSHTQRLSIQRRRRLERHDENLERRCVVTTNVDDFSLVPLTLSDLPANLTSNLYPTILSSSGNSNHDVISEDSVYPTDPRIGSTDVTSLNRINNNSDDNNGAQGLGLEFQSEMRTVLQALFGDLRSTPTLLVTDSISTNEEEDENASNANREIELYTLRKTK